MQRFKRLPKHIAAIPDGNRRWAERQGYSKETGYLEGVGPGFRFYEICIELGIQEVSVYGFTQDNTKRPSEQRVAFQRACVDAVERLSKMDAALLVVGNDKSPMFPPELMSYTTRKTFGKGLLRVNFLVNYDWHWDLSQAFQREETTSSRKDFLQSIGSADVSRVDLVIRWGGRRRLSGLLPVQTVYADFYVVDALWPDFQPDHLYSALRWYEEQDITLGG